MIAIVEQFFVASTKKQVFSLICLGVIFYLPFLGNVHLFDWDEINFAESAREMIVTGDYLTVSINYEPFWEKPPLFFWMQVLAMKVWGVTEFAARLPNAICGIATLLAFYFMGRRLYSKKFGALWAILYLGAILPALYFKSGVIDPVFNLFIFLSIFFLYCAFSEKRSGIRYTRYAILSGIMAGLAVLTKGPVAILLIVLSTAVFLIFSKRLSRQIVLSSVTALLCCIFVSSIWYVLNIYANGWDFFQKFIAYQIELLLHPVAGHEQPWYYHFIVVLVGCFPLSVYALKPLITRETYFSKTYESWMACLLWVVLILFTLVTTKIVHYSSMAYLPLSYLATRYLYDLCCHKKPLGMYYKYGLITLGIIWSLLLSAIPLIAMYDEWIIPYLRDPFAIDCLTNSSIHWVGYEPLIGLGLLGGVGVFSYYSKQKKNQLFGFVTLSLIVATVVNLYLLAVTSNIEGYSQRPAINLIQSIKDENAYITTRGYKSYAHYFYGLRTPQNRLPSGVDALNNHMDRPVYFILKSTNKELDSQQNTKLIGKQGGFKMYIKLPHHSKDTIAPRSSFLSP